MSSSRPKLTYFDLAASRGEECRIALHVAGVDFEDVRLRREDWMAKKPTTPFGSMPVFELPGHAPLAQSNAILVLIGQLHALHPSDPFEAARHLAIMEYCEELRAHVTPSLRITDPAEKKAAREKVAAEYLPTWGGYVERLLGAGPFFAGEKLHVVDVKLYMTTRWFKSGVVDHIPTGVFAPFEKLNRLHDAVAHHPRVADWLARQGK